MPYYSPTNLGGGEDIPDWIEDLRNYFGKLSTDGEGNPTVNDIPIKPFRNNMTLGEARKSILFLTRVATDTDTVAPTIGLLPIPINPIIST